MENETSDRIIKYNYETEKDKYSVVYGFTAVFKVLVTSVLIINSHLVHSGNSGNSVNSENS